MSTIRDVALKAGVSIATVSRYINGNSYVGEETARRIASAVAELRYLPNGPGRSLRTTHSNFILVLLPSVENGFLSRVIRGIQNVGYARHYSILIGVTQNDTALERSYLNILQSHGADGAIVISPSVEKAELEELSRGFPIVQCSEYISEAVPHVTIDNGAAAYEMTQLLLRCGRRRIAFVGAGDAIPSMREREKGFRRAMAKEGLPVDENMVARASLGFSGGRKAAETLLRAAPDAVFAAADIIALGVLKYAADAGIPVPGRLAVAGFDGIPRARESTPALTTVIQPAYEMGRAAAQFLFDRIDGKNLPLKTVLPYRLAVRQSAGPPGLLPDAR